MMRRSQPDTARIPAKQSQSRYRVVQREKEADTDARKNKGKSL